MLSCFRGLLLAVAVGGVYVVCAGSVQPQGSTIAGIGPNMASMFDIMSDPMSGEQFDRAYLKELGACFNELAPGLGFTSDRKNKFASSCV